MKLIKEIKTDFGKNVKYYDLGSNKTTRTIYSFIGSEFCNTRVLKITNYKGSITEERFHSFIGGEFTTDIECLRYMTKFKG
tara:strand:+ start:585 stop:827 length:243 start_codon:yes stop_codon:yes gene_type:complete